MKNAKKILALLLCAVLLVCATIAGTVAYLQAQTATVTNTFTVGKVSLGEENEDGIVEGGLNEAKVNVYGEKLNDKDEVAKTGDTLAARVTANTYKLIPGHTYVKDPTIHVAPGSENCWLFVKVVNGIEDIEAEDNTIADQMAANNWVALAGYANMYAYNTTINTLDKTDFTDYPVFGSFTLITGEIAETYKDAKIEVIAYAVQADGFDDAADAWGNTFGATTNP